MAIATKASWCYTATTWTLTVAQCALRSSSTGWDSNGDPSKEQVGDDCNEPVTCLAYSPISNEGNFQFGALAANESVSAKLTSWGVPSQMFSTFEAAALVESAVFVAFEFSVVAGGDGHVEGNVGTARLNNGTVQMGPSKNL